MSSIGRKLGKFDALIFLRKNCQKSSSINIFMYILLEEKSKEEGESSKKKLKESSKSEGESEQFTTDQQNTGACCF